MDDLFQQTATQVLTVGQFNRLARSCLESAFPLIWIGGEISNLTVASSGHAYFVLKDADAQVRCIAFRSRLQAIGFRPANGDRVEVRALPTLYEARGDLQLNVETMRLAGQGDLHARFLALKEKLAAENLFADEHKKPLPAFVRRVGVVTSPQAAALRDVVTTLRRRAPQVAMVVYPTRVQGEGAAAEIASAIGVADARNECDVLIVCRGGGSLEDLWAFNEEIVARAIYRCALPVVTGIGHQTDFTISDFVADLRAPTPTAAAELAVPARDRLLDELGALARRLRRETERNLHDRSQRLDQWARRLRHPADELFRRRARLDELAKRLPLGLSRVLALRKAELADLKQHRLRRLLPVALYRVGLDHAGQRLRKSGLQLVQSYRDDLAGRAASLAHLNPLAVLERGYAIVTRRDGSVVSDSAGLAVGETVRARFHSGTVDADVIKIDPETPGHRSA